MCGNFPQKGYAAASMPGTAPKSQARRFSGRGAAAGASVFRACCAGYACPMLFSLTKERNVTPYLAGAHVPLLRAHYRRPCPGNTVTILPSSCLILSRCTCFIPSPVYHDCPSALVALYGHGACTEALRLTPQVNCGCLPPPARPLESWPGATPSPA